MKYLPFGFLLSFTFICKKRKVDVTIIRNPRCLVKELIQGIHPKSPSK